MGKIESCFEEVRPWHNGAESRAKCSGGCADKGRWTRNALANKRQESKWRESEYLNL